MARGDTWTREELLILFEELHSREWKAIRSDQGIAEELSELLQSTYVHVRSGRDVTFRSPDAVQRKAYDFITSRREIYQGKQTRGGHGVRDLLKEVGDHPAPYLEEARSLRAEFQRTTRACWWVIEPQSSQPDQHDVPLQTRWPELARKGTNQRGRNAKALLLDMRPGDIVFRYAGERLHGLDVVSGAPVSDPAGSDPRSDDKGTIEVPTISLFPSLDVGYKQLLPLMQLRSDGPFGAHGRTPKGLYVRTVTEKEARKILWFLCHDLGLPVEVSDATVVERQQTTSGDSKSTDTRDQASSPLKTLVLEGGTDAVGQIVLRMEQSKLRRLLVDGRQTAPCTLCDRVLPIRMLVAAHIKPRALATEQERLDLDRIGMLACTGGCDTLFEHGYVVVDDNGHIAPGREPETEDLKNMVQALEGRVVEIYDRSAGYFRRHQELHGIS